MDNQSSHPEDLTNVERLLASWKPAPDGLDHEAMLFAAGRASARSGKSWVVWPTLAGCLALTAIVLGAWWSAERTQRLALLHELQSRAPSPAPVYNPTFDSAPPAEALAPNAYLALYHEWQKNPLDWPIATVASPGGSNAPATDLPIPKAWQPHGPPDPL
jgi:hypothetical protein